MNPQRTTSMLQRLPVILAVTAASYGLPLQSQAHRVDRTAGMQNTACGNAQAASGERSFAQALAPQN